MASNVFIIAAYARRASSVLRPVTSVDIVKIPVPSVRAWLHWDGKPVSFYGFVLERRCRRAR